MGKRLVIKGADFSRNSISNSTLTWYIQEMKSLEEAILSPANIASAGWSFKEETNSLLVGKNINCVQFIAGLAGTLNLYIGSLGTTSLQRIASISISSSDVNTEKFITFPTVTVGNGQHLIIAEPQTTGSFRYFEDASNSFFKTVQTEPTIVKGYSLGFNVGFVS